MAPSFTDIITEYIAAFNSRDLEKTASFLSPDIQVTYLSNKLDLDLPQFKDAFLTQWADPTFVDLTIENLEEIEQGTRCITLDAGRGRRATVEYTFAENEVGEWRIVRQDMTAASDVE